MGTSGSEPPDTSDVWRTGDAMLSASSSVSRSTSLSDRVSDGVRACPSLLSDLTRVSLGSCLGEAESAADTESDRWTGRPATSGEADDTSGSDACCRTGDGGPVLLDPAEKVADRLLTGESSSSGLGPSCGLCAVTTRTKSQPKRGGEEEQKARKEYIIYL